jgi:hypothetical protein
MFRSVVRWWVSAAMTGLIIGATTWFLFEKWQTENAPLSQSEDQIVDTSIQKDQTADAVEADIVSNESVDEAEAELEADPSHSKNDPVFVEENEVDPLPSNDLALNQNLQSENSVDTSGAAEETSIATEAPTSTEIVESKLSDTDNVETDDLSSEKAEAQVTEAVRVWAKAWMDQDIDRYIAAYHSEYKGDSRSHEAWVKNRSIRLKRPKWIRVDLGPITFTHLDSTQVEITFWQVYRASNYQDEVQKRLVLSKEGDAWRIVVEGVAE